MDTAASVAAIRLDRCLPAVLQVFCNGKCLSIDDFHLCFPTKSRSSAVIRSVNVGGLFLLVARRPQNTAARRFSERTELNSVSVGR